MHDGGVGRVLSFDLAKEADELNRLNRPKRALMLGFGILWVVGGAAGWLLILTASPSQTATPSWLLGPALLGVAGLAVGAVCLFLSANFPPSPTRATVTSLGVTFERDAPRWRAEILWSDPALSLTVYDYRPYGTLWNDHRTVRGLDFTIVNLYHRLRAPATARMIEAMIQFSSHSGVKVTGWLPAVKVPGPARKISFRHPTKLQGHQ